VDGGPRAVAAYVLQHLAVGAAARPAVSVTGDRETRASAVAAVISIAAGAVAAAVGGGVCRQVTRHVGNFFIEPLSVTVPLVT
jgi:hypothetical protein